MTATIAPADPTFPSYRLPALLGPIDVVDLLELCGTASATAGAMGLSQPTVSRRYSALASDLGLRRWGQSGPQQLLYGDTTFLRLLRQAYQWHRLEAGLVRLAANPCQELLLEGLPADPRLPLRFRQPGSWRRLLEAAIIDGALLSSLDLELLHPGLAGDGQAPVGWGAGLLWPLPAWPLGLWLPPTAAGPPACGGDVLLPPEAGAPGLAALAKQRQWRCRHASQRCRRPATWASWMQQQQLPALTTAGWAGSLAPLLPGWRWSPLAGGEQERLWLLLASEPARQHRVLHDLPEQLSSRINNLQATNPELAGWASGR